MPVNDTMTHIHIFGNGLHQLNWLEMCAQELLSQVDNVNDSRFHIRRVYQTIEATLLLEIPDIFRTALAVLNKMQWIVRTIAYFTVEQLSYCLSRDIHAFNTMSILCDIAKAIGNVLVSFQLSHNIFFVRAFQHNTHTHVHVTHYLDLDSPSNTAQAVVSFLYGMLLLVVCAFRQFGTEAIGKRKWSWKWRQDKHDCVVCYFSTAVYFPCYGLLKAIYFNKKTCVCVLTNVMSACYIFFDFWTSRDFFRRQAGFIVAIFFSLSLEMLRNLFQAHAWSHDIRSIEWVILFCTYFQRY